MRGTIGSGAMLVDRVIVVGVVVRQLLELWCLILILLFAVVLTVVDDHLLLEDDVCSCVCWRS